MAQVNLSLTERQFRCPICLEVLRDPVSIPCGHTYCMSCISEYWDQAEAGSCCPQCREHFSPRPVLRRNTVLAEVVERLRLTEVVSEPELFLGAEGEVPCDFCPPEARLRALTSCLVCLASFCELHLLPHRHVAPLRRHRLLPAVERLSERLCPQHRLGLEPTGPGAQHEAPTGPEEDQEAPTEAEWSGDCLLCEADREDSATCGGAEASRSRRQLQETQRLVQIQIRDAERELEEFQQNLESLKVSASAALEDSEAVFSDMSQRLEKTRAEVRLRLEAKERSVLSRAEKDLQLMEQDLEELRRRHQDLSQSLQSSEPEQLLQSSVSLLAPVARLGPSRCPELPSDVFRAAGLALCHLRSRLEELCREELDTVNRSVSENHTAAAAAEGAKGDRNHSAANCKPRHTLSADPRASPVAFPLCSIDLPEADQRMRASFLRYWCRLTLDADTANPTLVLLDGLKGAHCGEEPQPYPPHPQRFDSVAQVLCKEGQVTGVSYWEVEWRGGGWVDIGVTYRGIGRKGGGKPCLLGRNESSWRLRCTQAGYAAWHQNRKTTVAAPPCPRIGVLLERQKGALSFYSVSDSVLLLHTFRCPFTQPLYPAFRLDLDSTVILCPQEGS